MYDTAVVIVCVWVCECVVGVVGGGVGVRLGVGCPCPPFRNNIVTTHHLFLVADTQSVCLSRSSYHKKRVFMMLQLVFIVSVL